MRRSIVLSTLLALFSVLACAWAEDFGQEIIFVAPEGITVQYTDGTGRSLIVPRDVSVYGSFLYPAWSLDGTRFAFCARLASNERIAQLIVADADGSNPTVILQLALGHSLSYFQSISWHPNNQTIYFCQVYDNNDGDKLSRLCSINANGTGYQAHENEIFYVACEPQVYSQRYAAVWSANRWTYLHTLSYNGEAEHTWTGEYHASRRIRDICWRDANTLYIRWRNWTSSRDAICRATSGSFDVVPICQSSTGLHFVSPTFSPSRQQMYVAEASSDNSVANLRRLTLNASGDLISITDAGPGNYPNWRQTSPTPRIRLASPNGGEVYERSQPMTITWSRAGGTVEYYTLEWTANGSNWYPVHDGIHIDGDQTTYYWHAGYMPETTRGRLRIVGHRGTETYTDESDAYFRVVEELSPVGDLEAPLPLNATLVRNYPNPFNATTTVEYVIPQSGPVSLTVWNAGGQRVARLVDEVQAAGVHRLSWDASGLSSGTYYLNIRTGRESKSHAVFLIK